MFEGTIMSLFYLVGCIISFVISILILYGIVYCFINIFKHLNRLQNPDYTQISLNSV
jgi:hypothetical protein